MAHDLWTRVDEYLVEALGGVDDAVREAVEASRRAGLPAIEVSPSLGRLLQLLVRSLRAERVLEVGTLGGVSTIWMARGLVPGGRLLSLELDPRHAEVARVNLRRAGLDASVEILVGDAADTLASLAAAVPEPFDLVFVDADKEGYVGYFEAALALCRVGSLIVFDNVVRRGTVADATSAASDAQGVRELLDRLRGEPRVLASALQTVGVKGHDGVLVALVVESERGERSPR